MHQAITTWERASHKPHIILRIFKGLATLQSVPHEGKSHSNHCLHSPSD